MLDIIVFGRLCGKEAAKQAADISISKMTLAHVDAYAKELKDAGIETGERSPLLFPKYTRQVN